MNLFKLAISLLRFLTVTVLLLLYSLANAQVIDHIGVTPGKSDAEIVIHFSEKILYLRHIPSNEGAQVRIFLRLIETTQLESELAQELISSPKTERVPGITVLYPELVNGMLVKFSQPTRFSVRPGADGQSIVITVPLLAESRKPSTETLPAKKPEVEVSQPSPLAPPVTSVPAAGPGAATPLPGSEEVVVTPALPSSTGLSAAEVEARARSFLGEARRALAEKDYVTAINRLNRVLGMPSSSQTEAAQALIGEAREMSGEIPKAKAEYELYLKLFPAGPNAPRVREHLAAFDPRDEAVIRSRQRALPKEAGPAEWTFNGSVSSYYYTGNSQIETLVPPPPGQLTFNRETLSMVDQNSLITSINLNARRRDAFSDTRIVVRDTDNHNYLKPSRSYNRLYSAYIDHNDRQHGYYLRAGRQNPNGMGVMDRFDGIQAGYNLNPAWRVNAVYGDAVEFNSPFTKNFYGASVDLLPQPGLPGFSVYGIEQTLDGFPNRRAVGSEVRYFDGHATAYGMLDYDLLYKGVNIALLQGNYLSAGGDNYFFVIDHRRAPSYSLTNALPAAPGLSLQEMVAIQGIEQVRAQASALTAISDMFSVGVTHPLTENWQVGVDYRMSSISSTEPVKAILPLAVIGTCLA